MKKTAVDYLFEKLWGIPKDKFTWQMILKEAKQKEQKQIEKAFDTAQCDAFQYGDGPLTQNGKQYYYETYEKK